MAMAGALAGILGTGVALPEKVITNAELEKLVDTSDQWITERTGIKERRQAGPNETTSSLSIEAARKALDMAGLTPLQLDLIICSTISPDMPLPSTAAFIQRGLGAPACCAFDLAAACSGFLFGTTVAEQFIKTGKAKYVLVVGAELLSRYLDYRDRATCVLVEAKVCTDQLSLFIPHQANQRITDAVRQRLGVSPEKVYSNIARVGNTSSASIPICLDECLRGGRIKKGDLVLMSAFGAGVTWGAVLMRY